jgi:hypothetical protein
MEGSLFEAEVELFKQLLRLVGSEPGSQKTQLGCKSMFLRVRNVRLEMLTQDQDESMIKSSYHYDDAG